MARDSDSVQRTVLPTGWRIVGPNAEQIAKRVSVERLAAGPVTNTLYAVQCTMAPSVGGKPVVERVLDAVTEEIRKTWVDCPGLGRDQRVERAATRFGGMSYEVRRDSVRGWTGEGVWRTVHPFVAGAPITAWLMLEERTAYVRLILRVTADEGPKSVRGYVGAGQAQPAFLRVLKDLDPTWLGARLQAWPVRKGDVRDLVRSTLESDSRDYPVVVLSPLEDGSFVVDPGELTWELLGRARLHVIPDHRLTFELTDAVGDRRMSCYWGAARCYFPGWSRYDDPLEHPLLMGDRLDDPVMRATWLGEIGIWMATRMQPPLSSFARVEASHPASEAPAAGATPDLAPRIATERKGIPASRRDTPDERQATELGQQDAEHSAGSVPVAQPDYGPILAQLVNEVRSVAESVTRLNDEVERLRTISAVRSSSTNAIERRLGRLEDLLDRAFAGDTPAVPVAALSTGQQDFAATTAPDETEDRAALVHVVQAAAEIHANALVFLDSAYTSAAESPYEDPERVRAIFDAMARIALRRRDGILGTSLREAFSDLGIDYRAAIARNTPARLREQYRFLLPGGERIEAEEHIALGGTYDPRRCLRVYFSSRVPNEPRFAIAHVGRHFDVKTST